MALTAGMIASEILMCGVKAGIKQIPVVGEMAVHVVEGLQKRHEALNNAARMAEFEAQLSRVERGMRDTVEKEIRTILANLGRPAVPGPELTREMTELRHIYEQGWVPNLFEGILRNSSHWQELRRNPKQYGRILGDHEPVDPECGMHLLMDKDTTRILELPASSLAFLLGNQSVGIPPAEVRAAQDIWAFPTGKEDGQLDVTKGVDGFHAERNRIALAKDIEDRTAKPIVREREKTVCKPMKGRVHSSKGWARGLIGNEIDDLIATDKRIFLSHNNEVIFDIGSAVSRDLTRSLSGYTEVRLGITYGGDYEVKVDTVVEKYEIYISHKGESQKDMLAMANAIIAMVQTISPEAKVERFKYVYGGPE
jgi:hypothetical protein